LDDLFDDDFSKNTQEEQENKEEFNDNLFDLDNEEETSFSNDSKLNENEEQDLQKELEAKFDELFGPAPNK
jgi:hypothetical protein